MSTVRPAGSALRQGQDSMTNAVSAAVFIVLLLVSGAAAFLVGLATPPLGVVVFIVGFFLSLLIASSIKVANEWERGLILHLGKFVGIRGPGLFFVTPVLERVRIVDMRGADGGHPPPGSDHPRQRAGGNQWGVVL